MVFSSSVFLFVFLPVTLIGYFIVRKELKNAFLLLMSLVFYAWGEPKTVFIMIILSLCNYVYAALICLFRKYPYRLDRLALIFAVLTNVGVLFYFKYYDFTVANINSLFNASFALKYIALPIGISFFTFQGLSYVLDVYMKKAEMQKNPLNVLLYIALFPQLIAGPIVRYEDVNQQINHRVETLEKASYGVKRFIIGLSKKVLISNNFAMMADKIFDGNIESFSAITLFLGTVFYTFQIYYDFSGYSDMAIGLGKIFGFDFLENFNYPYVSKSITEFWKRWHISLSSWFRDYIYIPLGGSRRGNVYINLAVVFLITGVWHGASWNFILWGVWHGFFRLFERWRESKGRKEIRFGRIYTLGIVMIGWILFRCVDLETTWTYIKGLFCLNGNVVIDNQSIFYIKENLVLLVIAIIGSTPMLRCIKEKSDIYVISSKAVSVIEPIMLIMFLVMSFSHVVNNSYNPFIYFNF